MAIVTEVRRRFEEDPEEAFRWIENALYERTRRNVLVFEALLELIDDTVKIDSRLAKRWGHRAMSLIEMASIGHNERSWMSVKSTASAVTASCYTMCNQPDVAYEILDRLLKRPGLPKDIQGSICARTAITLIELGKGAQAGRRWVLS